MPHSYNKIWIHAIWSTKYRRAFILPRIEEQVYTFMRDQFVGCGCKVVDINGIEDHVHCLFSLSLQRSVADVIRQVKGSTAHYINQQQLLPGKFAWQTGYAAYSVSERELYKVERYIKNQKQHHYPMDSSPAHGFIRGGK